MSTNSSISRACVLVATAGTALVLGSGIASAHVTAKVLGEPAAQGGFTKITFRVPNEDPHMSTVKLDVSIPAKYALSEVSAKPMPGWTATVTTTKLNPPIRSGNTTVAEVVTGVSWTATKGTQIGPDQFQEFEITAGQLPDNTTQLMLPAKQTFDNGKTEDWNAPPAAAGAPEPEHPAPVVALSPKGSDSGDDSDHGAGVTAAPATANGSTSASATPATASDDAARWLGGAGLAVGALGLGFGVGATLLARRPVATTKDKA